MINGGQDEGDDLFFVLYVALSYPLFQVKSIIMFKMCKNFIVRMFVFDVAVTTLGAEILLLNSFVEKMTVKWPTSYMFS